jgi:hypothetical protein
VEANELVAILDQVEHDARHPPEEVGQRAAEVRVEARRDIRHAAALLDTRPLSAGLSGRPLSATLSCLSGLSALPAVSLLAAPTGLTRLPTLAGLTALASALPTLSRLSALPTLAGLSALPTLAALLTALSAPASLVALAAPVTLSRLSALRLPVGVHHGLRVVLCRRLAAGAVFAAVVGGVVGWIVCHVYSSRIGFARPAAVTVRADGRTRPDRSGPPVSLPFRGMAIV